MIDSQLMVLLSLTFLINLVGSLAYSVRLAGVRTRRIALSLSLFNVIVLISRTANTFQAPLLAKRVESQLHSGSPDMASVADFRWLLFAASLATVVGAVLTPTFQRIFTRAVALFGRDRSLLKLLLLVMSRTSLVRLREAAVLPSPMVVGRAMRAPIARGVMITNVFVTAVSTVGVFAALYAGYLAPDLRVTASNLSGIVTGVATILLFAFVDPFLAILTDDVMSGRTPEPLFKRAVIWMLGSRFAGTVLAQFLLLPAAHVIASVARTI